MLHPRAANRVVDRMPMTRRWEIAEQLGFKPKRFPVAADPVSSVEAAEMRPPAEPGSARSQPDDVHEDPAAPPPEPPPASTADGGPKARAADDLIAGLYFGQGELDAMDPPPRPGQMKFLPDEPVRAHAERLDRPSDGPASEEMVDLDEQQDDIATPPVTKREDEDIAPSPSPESTWDREEEVTAPEPDFGLFDDGPG